jgi:hypothetical protein
MPLDLSSMMPERLATLDAVVDHSREILDAASLKARAMVQTGEEFGWGSCRWARYPTGSPRPACSCFRPAQGLPHTATGPGLALGSRTFTRSRPGRPR